MIVPKCIVIIIENAIGFIALFFKFIAPVIDSSINGNDWTIATVDVTNAVVTVAPLNQPASLFYRLQ